MGYMIDTAASIEELTRAGFGSSQARALVKLISRSNESLLTRAEFKAEMKELRAEIEARFTEIEARFTGIEARFTGIEARFTGIEGRLDGLEARMDGLEARMEVRFDEMDAKFAKRFYVGFVSIISLMIALQMITLEILR